MALTLISQKSPGRRRIGLVLGAGGVLGAAWTVGALGALQDQLDRPLGELDMIVGTSSGSVLAAALRCGVEVRELVSYQRGNGFVALPHLDDLDKDSGSRPPLPRMRFGSPRLLASTARAPHRIHPWVAASALLPQGRAQHRSLTDLMYALLGRADGGPDPAESAWPERPTWVVAVDYESGRRVAFGRAGAPDVSLPDAVVASCSIPGWYEPKRIDGRCYVDGGVRSSTSLDLLRTAELDEVYVLAPMAAYETDRPRSLAVRAERFVRQLVTSALSREIAKVEAGGTRVRAITPGPDDLAAMGMNLMEPSRRLQVLEISLATSPVRMAALAPLAAPRRGVRAATPLVRPV
jgi:NTE family protein